MKYLFVCGVALFLLYSAYQAVRMQKLVHVSKELVAHTEAFSVTQLHPLQTFLFIGDSLGVGIGASAPRFSIAGRVGEQYPRATIKNISMSGYRIKDGLADIQKIPTSETYDVIFIQLGANDVIRLTSASDAIGDLRILLKIAHRHAKTVIFYTSGDVGEAPLFPFPLNIFYSHRSSVLYNAFKAVALEEHVAYVDLFTPREADPLRNDAAHFYATDSLHVSDATYAQWFERIRARLTEKNSTSDSFSLRSAK